MTTARGIRMGERRRSVAWITSAAILFAACTIGTAIPDPAQMAGDVGRLSQALPVLEDLAVTDFEETGLCTVIGYARGSFVAGDPGCAREQSVPFDDVALVDHARLSQTLEETGVDTDRLGVATYRDDGSLELARFVLNGAPFLDFYEYVYDPAGLEPIRRAQQAGVEFTRISEDWWFVRSPDD
jgi:hypothetical protein